MRAIKPKNLLVPVGIFLGAVLATGPLAAQDPLVFAVSSMTSPEPTMRHFSEFRDYLGEKLQRQVVFKQRRTYAEINRLLNSGEVDLAFTCTGGYLEGRKDFGLEALAVPVVKGKTVYRSYIIVAQASGAQSFEDLKNGTFAFTDPLSLTGRIYPAAYLARQGWSAEGFFSKTFFTASHDKSVDAVANGLAAGAAVDSLIFDSLLEQGDARAHQVRIVHVSPPFGIPPVVTSPRLNPEDNRRLLKILLGMANDPAGRKILSVMGWDGFQIPPPELYLSAYQLKKNLED